jgi:tetratricopeptide (TPR) repeat protein
MNQSESSAQPAWRRALCRSLTCAALLVLPVVPAHGEDAPAPAAVAAPAVATGAPNASASNTPAAAPEANVAPAVAAGSSLPAPLVSTLPELRPAFDALAAGKLPRARELFDTWLSTHAGAPQVGAVRFLRSRCDARLGNLTAADAGYREAEAALPELADWLKAERARMALRDGRFDQADDLVEDLSTANREFFGLVIERAQRELRGGRLMDALTTLGRLTPSLNFAGERALVSRLLADARLAMTGDRAAWHARLADIWRSWPKTDTGRDLEALLVGAVADASVAEPPLTLDELVEIALRRALNGGPKAAESATKALQSRFPRRITGLTTLLDGQATVKKRAAAVRAAITAVLPGVTEAAIRDALWDIEARSLRQNERYDDALLVYERIGREGGASVRRAAALLEGGRMARRMGRVTPARWSFDRFLARHREFPDARAEALWNLGWFAWRDGLLDEADQLLPPDHHRDAGDDRLVRPHLRRARDLLAGARAAPARSPRRGADAVGGDREALSAVVLRQPLGRLAPPHGR